jgi:hypothetical protein
MREKYSSNNSSKNKNIVSKNITLNKDGPKLPLNKKLITIHRTEYKKNRKIFLMLVFLPPHITILLLNRITLIHKKEIGIVYKYSELKPPTLLKIKSPLFENDKKIGRKITKENIENLLLISIFSKP